MQVRRQFAERPGIMNYAEKPDYARCVSIVASSALREMVKPGLLAVLAPCVVGPPGPDTLQAPPGATHTPSISMIYQRAALPLGVALPPMAC